MKKRMESVHHVMEITVVLISIPSSLFQTCFIVIDFFTSILKHPNKYIFNELFILTLLPHSFVDRSL